MKYGIFIDQASAINWGLNKTEALAFAFCYDIPSWAETIFIGQEVWYFASRNKFIEDFPIVTDSPDTVYRLYKELAKKGVIRWRKIAEKDCIQITEKGKMWNNIQYDLGVGKISEGRKKIRAISEKNPTNTITNNTIHSLTFESIYDVQNELKKFPLFEDNIDNRMTVWTIYAKVLTADFFLIQWEFLAQGLPTVNDKNVVMKDFVINGNWQAVKTFGINKMRGFIRTAGQKQNNYKPKKSNGYAKPGPTNNDIDPTFNYNGISVKKSVADLYQSETD